ncbi:MAG: serine/threonine protein kinase [Ktedonobacteraceae bacterium]|nr:serine/threonine protein kinase [Ktedonobacteraceae bacterium]
MSAQQRRIGQYELYECLEADTTTEVWRSFDTQQHRYVTLRIFRINTQVSPGAVSRFLREAQSIASLQHPNIVQVLDFQASQTPNSVASEVYLVQEYVEGQSLADYLRATAHQGKFLLPNELIYLLTPIAAALDYAHQQGIVHGNLRPSNILLDKHGATQHFMGEPKLTGFGMQYLYDPPSQSLNHAAYVSPEVAQGYAGNERSDLYSLGVILYEMATGVQPFQAETPNELLLQHVHAVPTSPALVNPHIPPAVTAVIMRALAKNPQERFPGATAMVLALARALNVQMRPVHTTSPSLPTATNSPTYLSPLPQRQVYAPPPTASAVVTPIQPFSTPVVLPQSSQTYSTIGTPDLDATIRRSDLPLQTTPPLHRPVQIAPPPVPVATPPVSWLRGLPKRNLYIAFIAVLVLVLLVAAVAIPLLQTHNAPPPSTRVVGQAFFVSSGLVSTNSDQGIADGMQIDFPNIAPPPSGKSYYVWLLKDNLADWQPLSLGALSDNNGHFGTTFTGDTTNHSDLLSSYSRLLVTEEDASVAPANPSLDHSTWRYYAQFSQAKNPGQTYSLLDHLRHLLAQDPKLQAVGLTGGLDSWLFRNTLKILEAAGSVRDAQKAGTLGSAQFMQRQLVRILDYLDSTQYVGRENLPVGVSPVQVEPPLVVRVALLDFKDPSQFPPGYLKHIGSIHLGEIVQSPGVTPDQKALALRINQAVDNVNGWLVAVHDDAAKLVQMSDAQLLQPQTLSTLNDLFINANNAFVGHVDPNTNQVREGVSQIHYSIQRLATFDITACMLSSNNFCM